VSIKGLASARRSQGPSGRFLFRPYALAGSRWEWAFGALCALLLGMIFAAELLTPDDVVAAIALLPMLAAAWVLSRRVAGLVAWVAALLFGLDVLTESANRPSVVVAGLAILVAAVIARLHAARLAVLLSSHRHLRPAAPTQAVPATLDRIDQFSHGVRSLTRRELQVARLAADGFTAAEIGHQLHIANRTVESHLASAYSKLRIRSRPELMRMGSELVSLSEPSPERELSRRLRWVR
jgi:DNA-binding CsgD family transcriptional regulator